MNSVIGWLTMEPQTEEPPARVWRDWLLVGLVAGTTGLEVVFRDDLVWRPLALVFGVILALTMLVRRTHPLASVGAGFGGLIALDIGTSFAVGQPFSLFAASVVVVFVYALFRWGSSRQAAIGLALVIAEILVVAATDFTGLTDLGGGLLVLLFPAALGLSVRYRRLVSAQRYDQVRAAERDQLARELHDTVAHHVSAIAIQAQAGRFLAESDNPRGAADALEVIEKEATRALTEMRSVVRSLRGDDEAEFGVTRRGIPDIAALASEAEAHGIRIDVEQCGDLDALSTPVQTALYRVAQESITNAQRHARHAQRVQVVITGEDHEVRLRVSDDGGRTPAPGPGGYGLVGMSERVGMLGGTMHAGPGPERGWLVEATILGGQPGIEVIAQAADGLEAVRLAQLHRPDVCLFDIRMPHLDGVEATRQLAGPSVSDPLAVVVITTFDTDEYVTGALRAGARGFLLKDAGPALLVQAIHAAAEGDALIAPSITVRLLSRFAESSPSRRGAQPVVPLTSREEDVIEAIAKGLTNAEIAAELFVSVSTVKFHISGLMDKIGAGNRLQLVIWAYETGRAHP